MTRYTSVYCFRPPGRNKENAKTRLQDLFFSQPRSHDALYWRLLAIQPTTGHRLSSGNPTGLSTSPYSYFASNLDYLYSLYHYNFICQYNLLISRSQDSYSSPLSPAWTAPSVYYFFQSNYIRSKYLLLSDVILSELHLSFSKHMAFPPHLRPLFFLIIHHQLNPYRIHHCNHACCRQRC